ncbi:hypothetical protein RRG08_001117 [Elysia crispata]|uniref:Uncharacterized protein n=1 Tax=Elysia crispata TaxID=231223 RepID=A0AAE1E5H4_9GAST|nr:hypothetical protein RRG08_001117 [Elysia crispata]
MIKRNSTHQEVAQMHPKWSAVSELWNSLCICITFLETLTWSRGGSEYFPTPTSVVQGEVLDELSWVQASGKSTVQGAAAD